MLMKHLLYFSLSFILMIFSCKKEETTKNTLVEKTGMNGSVKHLKYVQLNKNAIKEIKDWEEYFIIADLLKQLEQTTPTEALNNAIELKELTKNLKDSLAIETLKTPAFKARMNVFENEVLRLADMTYIPAISSREINIEVAKILLLFGSINNKINTVYTQKQFNEEINLDSLFQF